MLRATNAASRLKDAGKDLILQLHRKAGGPKNADITRGTLQTNSAQNCCGRSHNCQYIVQSNDPRLTDQARVSIEIHNKDYLFLAGCIANDSVYLDSHGYIL